MSGESRTASRSREAERHDPLPKASVVDAAPQGTDESRGVSPDPVSSVLAMNACRLDRARTTTVEDLAQAEAPVLPGANPGGDEVVAGVVVSVTSNESSSMRECGSLHLTLDDGTGRLSVWWPDGAVYEPVNDSEGHPLHDLAIPSGFSRPADWIVGHDDYIWREIQRYTAPIVAVGDLIAVTLASGEWEDDSDAGLALWLMKSPSAARVLRPIACGEDADWHPRFADPLPDAALSLAALMGPGVDAVHEAASPSLVTGGDGLSLVAEGTSVLVSGLPDSGKSWFAVLSMLELLRRKPWGSVVWFDADGLGAQRVRERFHALGCPAEWVSERLVIQPVPHRAEAEWARFASEVASEVMPIGVVWDGLNAALTATGCGMDEAGVVKFRQRFMDPFRHARPACLVTCTDHVTKSANVRTDRYSHGAQGKLAQHDQHLRIIASRGTRVTRTTAGEMIVISQRNRSGHDDWDDRTLTITPGDPFTWDHVGGSDLTPEERLDGDLDRVVSILRDSGPLNTTEIRRGLGIKSERVSAALQHGLHLGAITMERRGAANVYAIGDADADAGDVGEVS